MAHTTREATKPPSVTTVVPGSRLVVSINFVLLSSKVSSRTVQGSSLLNAGEQDTPDRETKLGGWSDVRNQMNF